MSNYLKILTTSQFKSIKQLIFVLKLQFMQILYLRKRSRNEREKSQRNGQFSFYPHSTYRFAKEIAKIANYFSHLHHWHFLSD